MNTTPDSNRHIYTISELNRDVKLLLESGFPAIWLEGEISNFTVPSSGHWYFSLKDDKAQVRCAMFKGRSRTVPFKPKQGDKVLVKAKISLYEARGDYQLIVDSMEEAGFGALQRQFEVLKQKLQKEGLFNPTTKKDLPLIPQQIGLITSPTGAAIKDILSVLKRRFPAVPVLVYPTQVQGETAAQQIAEMIGKANRHQACDVLILARGGGSLEDLWSFNEEIVARAIFHSEIPIVSGVGHEIDITIADFVADKRAPTPSAAAELVTPDIQELLLALDKQKRKLITLIQQEIKSRRVHMHLNSKRLKHPKQKLLEMAQKLDNLELRLQSNSQRLLQEKRIQIMQQKRLLQHVSPLRQMKDARKMLYLKQSALFKQINQVLIDKQNKLSLNAKTLNAFSPLATLERGYSIVRQRNNNCIIRSYDQVNINDELDITLSHGKIICTVKENSAD